MSKQEKMAFATLLRIAARELGGRSLLPYPDEDEWQNVVDVMCAIDKETNE